jgi:hypothetical protein
VNTLVAKATRRTLLLLPRQRRHLSAQDFEVGQPVLTKRGSGEPKRTRGKLVCPSRGVRDHPRRDAAEHDGRTRGLQRHRDDGEAT